MTTKMTRAIYFFVAIAIVADRVLFLILVVANQATAYHASSGASYGAFAAAEYGPVTAPASPPMAAPLGLRLQPSLASWACAAEPANRKVISRKANIILKDFMEER